MKNIRYLFLMLIVFSSCKIQRPIIIDANLSSGLELGGCYYFILQDSGLKKENSFILEILEPSYEESTIEYSEAELEKRKLKNGKYLFQARTEHFRFIKKDMDLSKFTNENNPIGFMYCLIQEPSTYLEFTEKELSLKNNKVPFIKVVEHSKIVKRYVKKKPLKLLDNQFFFKGGYWSDSKKAISHRNDEGVQILEVKRKLIELGYILTEDNILNQVTKDALLDFQRKNGLKEGQLDIDTLKKLGF